MDKPASKAALLQNIRDEHQRLEQSFKGISADNMIKTATPGEWSVQDILAHVTAWEQKFLSWYDTALQGKKPDMPDWTKPGVVDEVNLDIYRKNKDRWLPEVRKEFNRSYKQLLKTVKSIPEKNMFVPGKCPLIGPHALAEYIMSNTNRHYPDHTAMIEALRQKYGF